MFFVNGVLDCLFVISWDGGMLAPPGGTVGSGRRVKYGLWILTL